MSYSNPLTNDKPAISLPIKMDQNMTYRAILSKTTTDQIKSKLLSTELAQIVLDVYMTPKQYAELIEMSFEKELEVEIKSL